MEVLRGGNRLLGVASDRGSDLNRNEPIRSAAGFVDRAENVGRGLDVLEHQIPQHLVRSSPGIHQFGQRRVVIGRAANRLLEDRRVRRDPGEPRVTQPGELARSNQFATKVVQPQALALSGELLDWAAGVCRQ